MSPAARPLRAYLGLRLRLLGRLLAELGPGRLLALAGLLGLATLQALATLRAHPAGVWLVPGLAAAGLLGAHRRRADLRFLLMAVPGFRRWLAVEYALLALPLALGLLVGRAPGPAALLLGLAPLAALAPPARPAAGGRARARSWVRAEAFEWVSGGRSGWLSAAWALLLAGAIWQRAAPPGPALAWLGWALTVAGFYGQPEPPTMLALALGRRPGVFIGRRLALGLGYAGLTGAPLLGLLGAGPAGWGAALAAALYGGLLLALVILTKYAFYPNQAHIRMTQSLVLGVALLGAWHPAYPPLLAVISGGLWWQSRRRLARVLAVG